MKQLILVVIAVSMFIGGCTNIDTAEINELKRPVTVVANGVDTGGVLVSGSDGKLFLARNDTYLGSSLKNCKVGDVIAK